MNVIFPECARSTLGIGFDIDIGVCFGEYISVCKPGVRDRGISGIATEKVTSQWG